VFAISGRRKRNDSAATPRGFTLIEILVVVVVLGILAAIVIPRVNTAAEQGREGGLKTTLHRVREQLQLYRQHHGDWPKDLVRQMTRRSDRAGQTASASESTDGTYPHGPYLDGKPINPFTSGTDIGQGEPGSSAWYYNPETGAFKANDSQAHREL